MPTYDYRCTKCHHEFEAFQSITDDALVVCPKCRKRSLQRLIGAGAGIIFKGSGFYITDYKKGSSSTSRPSKPVKDSAKSADSGGSAGSGSSSD